MKQDTHVTTPQGFNVLPTSNHLQIPSSIILCLPFTKLKPLSSLAQSRVLIPPTAANQAQSGILTISIAKLIISPFPHHLGVLKAFNYLIVLFNQPAMGGSR